MSRRIFSKAVNALQNGSIIVYPTDTLYGIGADIFDDNAVKNVFEVKKRPFDMPLPVAVSCLEEIEDIAFINDDVRCLVDCFLPGGLTIILKKKNVVSDLVTGGLDKIAVRIPDNEVALRLISLSGPITATSANVHGEKTPNNIDDIQMQFENEDISIYLDYGELGGEPSTIVDMTEDKPKILREGVITHKEILDVIKNG